MQASCSSKGPHFRIQFAHPTASMSGTPRRHSLSQAAVNGFCKMVTKAEGSEVEDIIKQIAVHLREHPSEARPTMVALQSGLMGRQLDKAKTLSIPYTRCRIGDLSQKLLQHVIINAQDSLTGDILKRLSKCNKDLTHRLFFAMFAEYPGNPVFTHDVDEFCQAYVSKFKKLGMNMESFAISPDGKLQWSKSGCYKMEVDEEKKIKAIIHYSGKKAAISW